MKSPVGTPAFDTTTQVMKMTSLGNMLLASVAALVLVAVSGSAVRAQPATNPTSSQPVAQPTKSPSPTANPSTKSNVDTSNTSAPPPGPAASNAAQVTKKPSTITPAARVVILVDQSTQRMRVSVNGRTRYDFPVSTGRPGYNTPDGRFVPQWMAAMHHSKEYENAPMPHSIFFVNGDAIHGFTDTPFGVAAVSHGCVRLPLADATALFNLVKRDGMANTTIHVYGRIPNRPMVAQRQQPEYDRRYNGAWGYRQYSESGYPPPPFFVRPFLGGPFYGGQYNYRQP